jgi:thioesterase domain-containing protein/acyl carrier protein
VKDRLPVHMHPAEFVFLDAFPRSPNGKLDRKALPPPTDPPLDRHRSYFAPQTPTEQALANIWNEVLGSKQVGLYDNFFELGGHSLAVSRLITGVNQTFKVSLNFPEVFKNPNLEQLAKVIDGKKATERLLPSVSTLREGSVEPPIYFIFAGESECRLADLISTGQPVFAVDVPFPMAWSDAIANFDSSGLPTMAQLAAPFVSALHAHNASSSCVLAGFSFAGVVAFEVAQQLQQQGIKIDGIMLFDSHRRRPDQLALRKLLREWNQFLRGKLTVWSLSWIRMHSQQLLFVMWYRLKRFLRINKYSRSLYEALWRLYHSRKFHRFRHFDEPEIAFPNFPPILRLYDRALQTSHQRCLDLRGVLFRASSADEKILHLMDASLGWEKHFARGLEIVPVPGDHLSMIRGDTSTLCREINKVLKLLCPQDPVP